MAEILAGAGIHKAFKELGIKATRTYKGTHEPFYNVWELSKEDLKKLEYCPEWNDEWGWFRYSKGGRFGSACEILTVNGQMLIGWETKDSITEFDYLTDYFLDGLIVDGFEEHCALAVELAKANGMTMGRLFEVFQG